MAAAFIVSSVPSLAWAQLGGGGMGPGGGHADTQIPFGSTDDADQGGPGLGGMGGSSMHVSPYGRKSWPCYPAGQWAGSKDFHPPPGCPDEGKSGTSR